MDDEAAFLAFQRHAIGNRIPPPVAPKGERVVSPPPAGAVPTTAAPAVQPAKVKAAAMLPGALTLADAAAMLTVGPLQDLPLDRVRLALQQVVVRIEVDADGELILERDEVARVAADPALQGRLLMALCSTVRSLGYIAAGTVTMR